ncbi:RNA polymerase sigma factor [Zunongwangia sp. HGR-M22]|uniref:RNA polymerase sigma factor n=1 Tax=Zunongwangia sp. HGR-M22 TaxID=3015168 RepID=UPI0022DD12D2|nr:sigma-70 family RNA polymerase sigma factor [Zunongwangia sp. HGR-M22]WBL25310.1 sigma-70 family RNA polymerase sigma factor [Zunongwangia sp. HGR-M22]
MKSNRKTIQQLKLGNTKTFKKVYLAYYDKLFHICKKFQFKFLTPEDFIQEAFVKIYKNRHQLKEDVVLEAQIIVICKNIIYNYLQREKKIIPLDSNYLRDQTSSEISDYDETADKSENISKLIDQLPVQQKKIFKLHKLENYSYKEISSMTQLSHKTIANHIYLANNFIRKKIKKA